MRVTLRDRIEGAIERLPWSGCWIWMRSVDDRGYGRVRENYRMRKAHQVAYEVFSGPRNGLAVLHSCDITSCVNPLHLRLGTQQDNARDRDQRRRRIAPVGEKHGRAKLTCADVIEIRASLEPLEALAARYGISAGYADRVKRRATWKHI